MTPQPKLSFFTTGRRLPHKDSYIIVDQCYIQYMQPVAQSNHQQKLIPILFIYGGGVSGAQWESTPDLRPGWAVLASRLGYEVYILDTIDNGRSARAPDSLRGEAEMEHRTAKKKWELFRFGPVEKFETREIFSGSQFPIDHYDAMVGAQIARRRTNDQIEGNGIVEAIEMLGECWVIAHSHRAALMMDILARVEKNVRRMALIEPGGTSIAGNLRKEVPTAVVWGDYLETHDACVKIAKPIDEAEVEVVRLPQLGIKGNSHFPMSDMNSDEALGVVMRWLEADRWGESSRVFFYG